MAPAFLVPHAHHAGGALGPSKQRRNKTLAGPGGLEPPLFPLTAECFAIKLQANKTKSPAVAGVLVAFDLLNLIDYAKKASDCWLLSLLAMSKRRNVIAD